MASLADVLADESSMSGSSASSSPQTHSFSRPQAPTPLQGENEWSEQGHGSSTGDGSRGANSFVSLNSPASPTQTYHSPLLRSASEGEPQPYPFRLPHGHLSPNPGLSSADSSSASTRSSAYTNLNAPLSDDFSHVHVAANDEEPPFAITSDDVVHLLAIKDTSTSVPHTQNRAPIDRSRWSESYSSGHRSRSSSVSNTDANHQPDLPPRIRTNLAFDTAWQPVDEREELVASEDDTDDDHGILDEDDEDQLSEERTAAIVIAEEGRGLIVQGDGVPIHELQVNPSMFLLVFLYIIPKCSLTDTTHLLVGSSSTPNAMPAFLAHTIPRISTTLLALDISANFLGALPPTLALCMNLEELNIASNPLRVLPVFLADLQNLKVLIADSTGVTTLPDTLIDLQKLHTLSIRRNKMHSLPSWLCMLPMLQSLLVDGNRFQGPWKALVEPLLAKVPQTPVYPPSTPMLPSSSAMDDLESTDTEDASEPPSAVSNTQFLMTPDEEEFTITPDKALALRAQAPPPSSSQPRPLTRTRTTPSRQFNPSPSPKDPEGHESPPDSGFFGDLEIRKMKSAGDLRRAGRLAGNSNPGSEAPMAKPALTKYPTSVSSSNLLNLDNSAPERPTAQRFASVGPSTMYGSPVHGGTKSGLRPALTQSLWEGNPEQTSPEQTSKLACQVVNGPLTVIPLAKLDVDILHDGKATVRPRQIKEGKEKEKSSRWGFLKKMSMGKMRIDTPTTQNSSDGPSRTVPITPTSTLSSKSPPRIDLRLSTAGTLDALSASPKILPMTSDPDPSVIKVSKKPSVDALKPTSGYSLLAPPLSPTPKSAKRRSFLPIESPFQLNIPIPEASAFLPGVLATNGDDANRRTPSPTVDQQERLRKEEDRAVEAYNRALRSVMAYLRDMHDLSLSQQAAANGGAEDIQTRSRRPTVVEREVSSMTGSSIFTSTTESSSQLRSSESISAMRSGSSTNTMSVATTDSGGSLEERKFKDDKSKRAMVLKEIVLYGPLCEVYLELITCYTGRNGHT
jgi:hypothetical protein